MKEKLLKVLNLLKQLFEQHAKVLNTALKDAPEDIKNQVKQLHESAQAHLDKLPSVLAGEGEALTEAVLNALAVANDHVSNSNRMIETLLPKAVALHALEASVKTDYVKKDESKALCDSAKAEGEKAGKAAVMPMVIDMRKKTVELAGLPAPSDEVLSLPAEEFNTRFDTAKLTVASCTKRGIDGKHPTTNRIAWCEKDKALNELKELDALGLKEKETKGKGKDGKEMAGDPLRGGGGAGGGTEDENDLEGCVI